MRKARRTSVMVRLVALLVITLTFTLCFVSGTFAKYVTSADGSDNAQVAKWGVTVSVADSGTNHLFKNTYEKHDNSVTDASIVNTVVSTSDVVAPGTQGGIFTFGITGTPEVAVNVKFEMKVNSEVKIGTDSIKASELGVSGADYMPVVYTLKKGEAILKQGTLAEIAAYLNGSEMSKNLPAGTILNDTYEGLTLTWAWDFDASGAGTNDTKDTYLGNVIAGTVSDDKVSTQINFELKITVTQID